MDMERNDLNLLRCRLVLPDGVRMGCLGIRGGIIAQMADRAEDLRPAAQTRDIDGDLVFPGVIDSHTHIRGGAFAYREDFYSASCAAAAGGVTTVLEMPGSAKPASTPEHFQEKWEEMEHNIGVDGALYAGAGADNLSQLPRLAQLGAVAFKTFLMPPVPGREAEFYGMCAQSEEELTAVMEAVKATGLPLTLHCEDNDIIQRETQRVRDAGGARVRDYCQARPPQAEIVAVERALRCVERTGCAVNIAHVSTPEAARMIADARRRGVDAAGETCAQYLMFDCTQMDDYGPYARMKPPFRDRERVEQLQWAYAEGLLQYTGSDHAPFTPTEKTGSGSIWNSPDGLAGLEMTLLLLLELAEQGVFPYERIAVSTAANTAERFSLRGKGRIALGYDADLAVVRRCSAPYPFKRTMLHSKHVESGCIYESLKLSHRIAATYSRGRLIYDGMQVCLQPGSGRVMRPARR